MHQEVASFVERIKTLGFRVFVAERGEYGFITDETATRVLSWSFTDGGRLSGNYGPPSQECGTGWVLEGSPWDLQTGDDVKSALYEHPPHWIRGWKHFTTVEQHLAMYGQSSRYSEA